MPNASWNFTCDGRTEIRIKGEEQGRLEWEERVRTGQVPAGSAQQIDSERIVSIRPLDRIVVVVTERTIAGIQAINTFSRDNYQSSRFVVPQPTSFIDFSEVNDFLVFAYVER